jgi:hypothetical protein
MIAVLPNSTACKAAAKAVEPEPRITRSRFAKTILLVIAMLQGGLNRDGAALAD